MIGVKMQLFPTFRRICTDRCCMLKAKQSFNGQIDLIGGYKITCKDVYATGLDYQEMIVLWFLVLRTKVVWYETFKYKMDDVVDAKMVDKYKLTSLKVIISRSGKVSYVDMTHVLVRHNLSYLR